MHVVWYVLTFPKAHQILSKQLIVVIHDLSLSFSYQRKFKNNSNQLLVSYFKAQTQDFAYSISQSLSVFNLFILSNQIYQFSPYKWHLEPLKWSDTIDHRSNFLYTEQSNKEAWLKLRNNIKCLSGSQQQERYQICTIQKINRI